MSKQAIIDKILNEAEIRANSFVADQIERANDILAESADQCRAYLYSQKSETDKMVADIKARAKTSAELEARKLLLAAKTKVLDDVFARANSKLKRLDKVTLKKLFLGMLFEIAEDGDVVCLGKAQSGVLSNDDVQAIAKEKGISLSLSNEEGNFDGLVVHSHGVDKNLTFEVETSSLREEMQADIAKEIFG